jgi:hypothetical protein
VTVAYSLTAFSNILEYGQQKLMIIICCFVAASVGKLIMVQRIKAFSKMRVEHHKEPNLLVISLELLSEELTSETSRKKYLQ